VLGKKVVSFFLPKLKDKMFDKTRERIARLEETNETFRKVKLHLETNKKTYLVGGGCLVVGTVGMRISNLSSVPDVIQAISGNDNVGAVINRSKNVDVIIKYLNKRNYTANPIQCLETLQKWASQVEACEALAIPQSVMSKHLNGTYPHAHDLHFGRL